MLSAGRHGTRREAERRLFPSNSHEERRLYGGKRPAQSVLRWSGTIHPPLDHRDAELVPRLGLGVFGGGRKQVNR